MDEKQYLTALKMQSRDFEDTLQYQCALATKCDAIVTRNIRDFNSNEIPVYLPIEFLNTL